MPVLRGRTFHPGQSDHCSSLGQFVFPSWTFRRPFQFPFPSWTIRPLFLPWPISLPVLENFRYHPGKSEDCSSLGKFVSPSWKIRRLFLLGRQFAFPSWIFRRPFQPDIFADVGAGGGGWVQIWANSDPQGVI
jgi:hypothetical protein